MGENMHPINDAAQVLSRTVNVAIENVCKQFSELLI